MKKILFGRMVWLSVLICVFSVVIFAATPTDGLPLNPPVDLNRLHGIYITSFCAVSDKREQLLKLFQETELNAAVIDAKVDASIFGQYFGPKNKAKMKVFVNDLHKLNVWVIARIVVFRDHVLARKHPEIALHHKNGGLWQDNNGVYWIDPASKVAWDYNIQLAKDAIDFGFDEVNFDYIRFPSDGKISDILYPVYDGKETRAVVLVNFFKTLRDSLKAYKPGIIMSADLLGFSFVTTGDLKVGQYLGGLIEYFDYICPMIYPSHYYPGNFGLDNPTLYPYEVVRETIMKGRHIFGNQYAKIRPWLQDFSIRGVHYNADMVRRQKSGIYDCGLQSWVLWNANCNYTRAALENKQ